MPLNKKNKHTKEGKTMNAQEIANIIFNMSLDMDYADNIEFAEDEIESIAQEIEAAGDALKQALEMIALQNSDMKDWYKKQENDL